MNTMRTALGVLAPVPWRVKPKGEPGYVSIVDANGHDVAADVYQDVQANSAVLAAAPDLLAALRAAVAYRPVQTGRRLPVWVIDAKEAIARAEGGRS